MNPDQSIRIILQDEHGNRLRVSGIVFTVYCLIRGRRRFGFRVGPTKEDGEFLVRYSTLEKQRRRNAQYQVMDYNTRLESCDPKMQVEVPSGTELRNAASHLRSLQLPDSDEEANLWDSALNDIVKPAAQELELVPTGETVLRLVCERQ